MARVKNVWSYMGWDNLIAVLLFVIGILGFVIKPLPFDPVLNEIYLGTRAELIGIGIGVFVIANAADYMNRQAEKKAAYFADGQPGQWFYC